MVIYHFWKEDRIAAAIVLGVILIQRMQEIVKEEKNKYYNQPPQLPSADKKI